MSNLDMNHGNNSQVSIGSNKDKELPPIPIPLVSDISANSPVTPPGHNDNTTTNLPSDRFSDGTEILQTKTLKRKNFKKLSLDSSPTIDHGANAASTPVDAPERYESHSLRSRRQRAPPPLNLRERPKVDDANLLKTQDLTTQLSSLQLSSDPQGLNRKRQTVISSISPIRSTAADLALANSPSPRIQLLATPLLDTSTPTTPQQLHSKQQISLDDSLPPVSSHSGLQINDNKDLMVLKDLGSGNSGTVSKVVHLPSQTIMAKKIIPIDSNNAVQTQIVRELRILHECHSPYIIEFFGAFVNNNNIVICMEYCNCGSLDKILPLCEQKHFPTFVLKKLAFSILSGLNYLYQTHKILHRDIKPSNVLMTHKGEFKLCDFGVSRQLTNSITQADTFVGTSMYMSPERIQGLAYGIKSDVWSMGLLLIEMASGSPIWKFDDNSDGEGSGSFQGPEGILDLLQRIVNEEPPSLMRKVNPATKKPYDYQLCVLISHCLEKDLSNRRSPRTLLADKNGFLKGVEEGLYDKDVKNWAKGIRKAHIAKNDK